MNPRFPEYITVSVTRDDIDHGRPGSFCSCPVALAMQRSGIPEDAAIHVTSDCISVMVKTDRGGLVRADYCGATEHDRDDMDDFIGDFDAALHTDDIEPCVFTMRRDGIPSVLSPNGDSA